MVCKYTTLLLQKNILRVIIVCCLFCHPALAQRQKNLPKQNEITSPVKPFYFEDHDSSYYHSFEHSITARFYFSKKYAGLELERLLTFHVFVTCPILLLQWVWVLPTSLYL